MNELPLIFIAPKKKLDETIFMKIDVGPCFGNGYDFVVDGENYDGEAYTFFPNTLVFVTLINLEIVQHAICAMRKLQKCQNNKFIFVKV